MAADLQWTASRDHAGFVAGFLQSSNLVGRALASIAWGSLAGTCGYKKCILATVCSLILGGVAFGFCTTLAVALLARLVFLGLGNGWVVIIGPSSADVAGDARQTEVLGIIMATGSATQLFGPAVAGWTYGAVPAFPAAVPSGIGVFIGLAGLFACLRWMPAAAGKVEESKSEKVVIEEMSTEGHCSGLLEGPLPFVYALRFLQGLALFAFFDVFPLWAIASSTVGGLQLSETQVGMLLSRSAIWNVLWFSMLMPFLSRRLGVRLFGVCMAIVSGSGCVVLPWARGIVSANFIHMLVASTSTAEGAMVIAYTNNAAPQGKRGPVSGLGTLSDSLGKAFGPVGGAWLFAYTLQRWGEAGHGYVFWGLAGLHSVFAMCAACLPVCVESRESPLIDGSPSQQRTSCAVSPSTGGGQPLPELVASPSVRADESQAACGDAEVREEQELSGLLSKQPLPELVGSPSVRADESHAGEVREKKQAGL